MVEFQAEGQAVDRDFPPWVSVLSLQESEAGFWNLLCCKS